MTFISKLFTAYLNPYRWVLIGVAVLSALAATMQFGARHARRKIENENLKFNAKRDAAVKEALRRRTRLARKASDAALVRHRQRMHADNKAKVRDKYNRD